MTGDRYREIDPERLERILSHKVSSYAGAVMVMPLLLAVIVFGTITFRAERYQTPEIARILSPPIQTAPEQFDFSRTDLPVPQEMDFDVFADELQDRRDQQPRRLNAAAIDLPAARGTESLSPPEQTIDLDMGPDAAIANGPDYEGPADSNPGLYDPTGEMAAGVGTAVSEARLRQAGRAEPRGQAGAAAPSEASEFGSDAAGGISSVGDGESPVVVSRQEVDRQQGIGVVTPASEEKRRLTRWIDSHPSPLRPAIGQALGYDAMKRDRTAAGVMQDPDGTVYRMYFLHRTENDLLRILLVTGETAYRIDLPDLYLEANHVQRGGVGYAESGPDSASIIEVTLAAVPQVPAEVPQLFAMVLGWLETKGE